jgi:uncharacterized RDD family membrane protein YckC
VPKCSACGAQAADSQVFCTSCGARVSSPVAPPPGVPPSPAPPPLPAAVSMSAAGAAAVAVAAPPAVSAAPVYASIARRAAATFLDLFALVAFLAFFGVFAASRYGGWMPDGTYTLEPFAFFSAVGRAAAAWLAYFVILEWWLGGSLGKWVVGIRVTGMRGTPANVIQAVVRNLFRLIDGIVLYLVGIVFMLMTTQRQRLGDLVARTVVRVVPTGAGARAAAFLALAALPFASVGAAWYSGLVEAASNRWMSSVATTRLHGTAGYESHLEGGVNLGTGQSNIRSASGSYASGEVVNETLIMDSLSIAGRDGSERRSRAFRAGETVTLRFNLTGIAPSKASPSGHIRTTVRVVDSHGVDLVPLLQQEDEVAAGSRRVVPRRMEAVLPSSCPPGGNRLEIVVEDLVAGRHLKATIPFTVAR